MPVLSLLRDKKSDRTEKNIHLLFSNDPGGVPNFHGRWCGRDLGGDGEKG